MKKIITIMIGLFSACSTTKTNSANQIKIATFSNNFNLQDIKAIEEKLNTKIVEYKFDYSKDLDNQIKKYKPDLIIGANYLSYPIMEAKNFKNITLQDSFYKQLTNSTKTLYQRLAVNDFKKESIPLFLEDIRVFGNDQSKFSNSRADLNKLFNDPKNKITIHNNPKLIAWIAMNIFGKNLPPHIIANPDEKRLKQALKMFFETKAQKDFVSIQEAIINWNKIDIFIGPNWIVNFTNPTKANYLIDNYNLITLNSIFKTKYANDKSDELIKYIQLNYNKLSLVNNFTPVTLEESKAQFSNLSEDKKYSMVLSNEMNYYYFIDQNHAIDNMPNYINKKIDKILKIS